MPVPFLYHVWHRPEFDALPAFRSRTITVPSMSGAGAEAKEVYSLKRDLDQLRADGSAKGIADSAVVSVGKSVEGRELWALKLGKGSAHPVLFTGCHHAREWVSVEIAYAVAEYLVQQYEVSPATEKQKRIKHLLENREIWFVPMVNPDGHDFTMRSNRDWRPNRAAYNLPAAVKQVPHLGGGSRTIRYPANVYVGVDLNRNYATSTWGRETDYHGEIVTSGDPRDGGAESIWFGPSANSEPEGQAIAALMKAHKFRASITYHSYSQLLLFPEAAKDDRFLQFVGEGMRDLINQYGNPYTYESGSELYPTTGDLLEFSYEQSPGRPTFTPELRPKKNAPRAEFFSGLPEAQLEPCFRENLAAALALINCAGHQRAAGSVALQWPGTGPCQVVRNCWNVFKGWTP